MSTAEAIVSVISRWRRAILSFWILSTLSCAYFAYSFFISTSIRYSPPRGSPGYDAVRAFEDSFPSQNRDNDIIVLINTMDESALGDLVSTHGCDNRLRYFTEDLIGFLQDDAVDFTVLSYLLLADPPLQAETTAGAFLNDPDPSMATATLITISPQDKDALVPGSHVANKFMDSLDAELKRLKDLHIEDVQVRTVGMLVIGRDSLYGTEHDLVLMDGTAFPFAMVIFFLVVGSCRLLIIPGCVIVATGVCSFAIMYPVALSTDVMAVAPSVMMAASIAFGVDYSLFLLSRWREEVVEKNKTVHDACVAMVGSAGHTIAVSGATIALCWFGLCVFPTAILSTVGGGAGLTIIVCFVANITICPAMLLTFPSFFASFKGWGFSGLFSGKTKGLNEDFSGFPTVSTSCSVDGSKKASMSAQLLPNAIIQENLAETDTKSECAGRANSADVPRSRALSSVNSFHRHAASGDSSDSMNAAKDLRKDIARLEETCWYRCGKFVFGTYFAACVSVLVVVGFAAPLVPYALDFHYSESFQLIIPRGYQGTDAYIEITDLFPAGRITPFNLLVRSRDTKASSVLSDRFFDDMITMVEQDLLSAVARSDPTVPAVLSDGISGLMYMRGTRVRFSRPRNASNERSLLGCAIREVGAVARSVGIDLDCVGHEMPMCTPQVEAFEDAHPATAECLRNASSPLLPADPDLTSSTSLCKGNPNTLACLARCLVAHPLVPRSEQHRDGAAPIDDVTHELMACILVGGASLPPGDVKDKCVTGLDSVGADHRGVAFVLEVLRLAPWIDTSARFLSNDDSEAMVAVAASTATIMAQPPRVEKVMDNTVADCRSILAQAAVALKYELVPELDSTTRTYRYVHIDNALTWLMVELNIKSDSSDGSQWIEDERELLDARMSSEVRLGAPSYEFWLAGPSIGPHDTVATVYAFFPVAVGVTVGLVIVIVGLSFRSVLVPIRSIFTIAITLSIVYGCGVLVYERRTLDGLGFFGFTTPEGIDELNWITPVMMFSVLIGLSLDYDIFLLERVYEYRLLALNDRDALLCGLAQTGGIITAAGLIMTVAFAGLLFSSNPGLNQISFFLVVSVLVDTFIVRTILVPSLMVVLGPLNWWPRSVPRAITWEHSNGIGHSGDGCEQAIYFR